MREYGKVGPQFWFGKTGKKLRAAGTDAQLVALYLMTNPHANMLGLYYVSIVSIAHETGMGFEGAKEGLRRCIEAQFCQYDEDAEVVWVMEMAFYQIAESLSPNDNRCKGIQNEYNALPANAYLAQFYAKYREAFSLTNKRESVVEINEIQEAPPKPLRSQEQEQEKEQEQEQEHSKTNTIVTLATPNSAKVIFEFWQQTMNSPKSAFDQNRKALIEKALKHYTPKEICQAIKGCAKSPFHMGDNERKTKYNSLSLILKNAEKIDQFLVLNAGNATISKKLETIAETNARVVAEFLGGPVDDGKTIDMEV